MIAFFIILCFLLIILLTVSTIFILRLIGKVDFYENWILDFKNQVLDAQDAMRKIDLRGAFEADDEVGEIFKAIQVIINDLQTFVE